MTSNAILSLAILKVNYDENKDYLETFIPMIAECIKDGEDDVIGITDIQNKMKELFHLNIPQHAIKALLNKACKLKYLIKDNKKFIRNNINLKNLNFKDKKVEMLKKQNELVLDLIEYVDKNFDELWEIQEAEEYLLKFIESNQIMSFKKIIFDNNNMNITNKERMYVAKYIENLIKIDSHLFSYLEEVLKGLIISTIVFVKEPSEIKKKINNMTVYFDTSFIIFALGYADEIKKTPCEELLNLINENNINARCFRHTIDEVIGILTACAYRINREDMSKVYGPSIEYFIRNNKTKSDIQLMINNLEANLLKIKIKIEDTPDYNNKCYIDEEKLKESLSSKISYNSEQAVDRDIKSISAIMRLRNGRETSRIEDSKAIFITTNFRLIKEVNRYLNIDESLIGIMPIISDYAFTNFLWLKKPLVSNDLSRKRIIAECYAATQPTESLWNKYIREIDNLKERGDIDEDESCYFKYAPVIKDICMEITRGDEETICEGTALEVIKRAREVIAIEEKEKLEDNINFIKEENKKANYEIENKNKEIKRKDIEIGNKEKHANKFFENKSLRLKKILKVFMHIISIVGLVLGQNLISNYFVSQSKKATLVIDIALFILTGIGVCFSIKGDSIDTICEKVRIKYYNYLIKDFERFNEPYAIREVSIDEDIK